MASNQQTTYDTDVSEMQSENIETTKERVELTDLRKDFGEVVAVDGISLTVEEGELVVLLGPSGCGKSTTLRMIAGLETPSGGRIHIGSDEVTMMPPQKRNLSMVFQSYALYPHLTVRGNLEYPLRKTDLSPEQRSEKVESVASMLGITEHLDKEPDQLSGGQQQRVAVGRTIVREPRVFLMDEPLSNLDAKLRVKTRAELRGLQQQLGVTTIYVTHDQEEAMSIADRLVIMNDARIEQAASPKEVYENPANEFVAEFLGEPSINIVSLESDWARNLVGEAGSAATLGIRPENLYLRSNLERVEAELGDLSDPVLLEVELIEPLGDTYELTLTDDNGETVTVLSRAGRRVDEGDQVEIVADTSSFHLFDENQEAIR